MCRLTFGVRVCGCVCVCLQLPLGVRVCVRVWAPEVVQVGDLLHAEPAELGAADGTGHVITAAVVHLDDVRTAARAGLDVISWGPQCTVVSWIVRACVCVFKPPLK